MFWNGCSAWNLSQVISHKSLTIYVTNSTEILENFVKHVSVIHICETVSVQLKTNFSFSLFFLFMAQKF